LLLKIFILLLMMLPLRLSRLGWPHSSPTPPPASPCYFSPATFGHQVIEEKWLRIAGFFI